jgi:hypothetical protein
MGFGTTGILPKTVIPRRPDTPLRSPVSMVQGCPANSNNWTLKSKRLE